MQALAPIVTIAPEIMVETLMRERSREVVTTAHRARTSTIA
jgi:hypothetical protein